MATVTAFLKHSNIGKAKQAEPYTAAAHARYITRKNAASLIYSERMPRQYHAVQRFLNEHEDGVRKNGRVIDKFIISVPHDVSEADAVNALRRFGNRLGKGKAPFLFALHGFETRNHHAHFIFIDRDPETGRRVFGTSERGSTASIKLEWETSANGTFAELGYDVRVKVSEGYAEQQAEDLREASNDNHIGDVTEMVTDHVADAGNMIPPEYEIELTPEELSPEAIPDHFPDSGNMVDAPEPAPLSPVVEVEPPTEFEASSAVEETEGSAMEDEDDGYVEYPGLDLSNPADALKALYQARYDLSQVQLAKERLQEAEQRYAQRVEERQKAAEAASEHFAYTLKPAKELAYVAQTEFAAHQTSRGGLKGFGLRLPFGFEIKTRARKQAEVALDNVETSQQEAQRRQRDQEAYDNEVRVKQSLAEAAERDAENRRNHILGVYGSEKDMEAARRTFENTVARAAEGLTMDQVMTAALEKEVTLDHVRAYVETTGNRAILDAFDEGMEQDGPSL